MEHFLLKSSAVYCYCWIQELCSLPLKNYPERLVSFFDVEHLSMLESMVPNVLSEVNKISKRQNYSDCNRWGVITDGRSNSYKKAFLCCSITSMVTRNEQRVVLTRT